MNAPISYDPRAHDMKIEHALRDVARDTRAYRPRLVVRTHILRDIALTFAGVFISCACIVSMMPA
jgi:hypothetical protein